jgi:hemerythrin-like domain-containing protein
MPTSQTSRRDLLAAGTAVAAACALVRPSSASAAGKKASTSKEKEVGAVEDLMREHGVLRRALLVYRESTPKLRAKGSTIDPSSLHRTAQLFRAFGEDYHEKKLEEAFILPVVKRSGGAAASYVDVIIAQHARGREVTEYILDVTASGRTLASAAESLASALESFVVMYQNHAAREDTIVFPAWKNAISETQLKELGEKFEQIEKQQFGSDGYEDAVKQIGDIEQALGLADLAQFTPPPPPQRG